MRSRRWVLYVVLIIIVLLLLTIEGRRITQTSDGIKNFVLAKLKPVLGDEFTIERVTIGIGNVHFYGISVPLPKIHASLEVHDLRIGYNIFRVLREGFHPQFLSQDFLLVNPRFHLYLEKTDSTRSKTRAASSRYLNIDLQPYVQQLSFIKRLSIKDGEFLLQNLEKPDYEIVNSISGWLEVQTSDTLDLRLSGNLFDSNRRNIAIAGKADLSTGFLENLSARIDEFELIDFMPFTESTFFEFVDGLLNFNLSLRSSVQNPHELEWNGMLNLSYAAATFAGKRFTIQDSYLNSRLENGDWIIDRAEMQLNQNPFSVSGSIQNLLNPTVDLKADAAAFRVADLVTSGAKQDINQIDGRADIHLAIQGPLDSLYAHAQLYSAQCRINNLNFTKIHLVSQYHRGVLILDHCKAELANHQIILNNRVDIASNERSMKGTLSLDGDFLPQLRSVVIDTISAIPTTMKAQISGSLQNPILSGNFDISAFSGAQKMKSVSAAFSLEEHQMQLHSVNGTCKIQGSVNFTAPASFQLNAEKLENILFFIFKFPQSEYFSDNISVSMDAAGSMDHFKTALVLRFVEGGIFKSNFAQIHSIFDRQSNEFKSHGTVTLYPDRPKPLSGRYSFMKDASSVRLQELNINDCCLASVHIQKMQGEEKSISADIDLSNFQLSDLWSSPDSLVQGIVDLNLLVKGTSLKPEMTCHAKVRDIYYKDYGPYETIVSLNYNSTGLAIEKFLLNSATSTLMSVRGNYDSIKDSLILKIEGSGFDLGAFTTPASHGKPFLTGTGLVDLQITGSRAYPRFNGVASIRNGAISTFLFTDLEVVLQEDGLNSSSAKINFSKIRLSKAQQFEVVGSGFIPIHKQDSLYLDIQGSGNFLAPLTDLTGFFKNTYSEGGLSARVIGTPQRPVLEKANLSFQKGQIEFGSVIPKVTTLQGEITFEPDEQFIHIRTLNGKMGDRKFDIHNCLATPELAARPLENLVLGSSGMNLGVIILQTPEQGIPLNFTGLMEPGNYGHLDLMGRFPGEQFYFCGPSDRPLLRGTINLNNTEIMYPFYETGKKASEPVKEFVESIEWDLDVIPIKDVRFTRSYPGAIDRAYVNLVLDERFGGLEFTGQIRDESFRINGSVRSTTGFIEYLDINFQVDRMGVEFDRSSLIPVVYGQATTTLTDSTGMPSQVMLTLQTVDQTIDNQQADDLVREEQGRARFDEIRFKLSSNNPNLGTTEAEIMASLGYSTETLQNKAFDAIGYGTESYLFRPLYRPVEREIEKLFGLDYVRFSSRFAKNLIDFNMNNNLELNNRVSLLKSTKVILGKYIADRFFLQYTGQVETGIGYRYKEKGVGLHHTLGLEYHVSPQLLLELEYDYDSLMQYDRDDKRIVLRHWFPF